MQREFKMKEFFNIIDIKLYLFTLGSFSIFQLLKGMNGWLVALSLTATCFYTAYKIYWGVIDRKRKNKAYWMEMDKLEELEEDLEEKIDDYDSK